MKFFLLGSCWAYSMCVFFFTVLVVFKVQLLLCDVLLHGIPVIDSDILLPYEKNGWGTNKEQGEQSKWMRKSTDNPLLSWVCGSKEPKKGGVVP